MEKFKIHLSKVNYAPYTDAPRFWAGPPLYWGSLEQLVRRAIQENLEKPVDPSKKRRIIPETLDILYNISKISSYDIVQDTSTPFWWEVSPIYKRVEVDLSKKFPDNYFRQDTREINIEVEIECDAEWTYKTTRRRRLNK